jgi:hypothetical protein
LPVPSSPFARLGYSDRRLAPYPNVVLLLPSPDLDESVALLRKRNTPTINDVALNQHLITHHSNHDLATVTVYTEGKTPEETCDEVLQYYAPD